MAVVMLKDLPGGPMPGASFPTTDWTTYLYIENAVKNILQGCISPVLGEGKGGGGGVGFVNPVGYDITGKHLHSSSSDILLERVKLNLVRS